MNAFAQLRGLIAPLLVFSFITNLSVLISPLFMMQVLDRVLPSGNIATLVLLAALAIAALALQAVTEAARDISLGRLSRWSERYGADIALRPNEEDAQGLIDKVSNFAGFIGGSAALVALNIPWIPLICAALLFIHPSFLMLLMLLVVTSKGIEMIAASFASSEQDAASKVRTLEKQTLARADQVQSQLGMQNTLQNLRQRFFSWLEARHTHMEACQRTIGFGTGAVALVRSSGQILALALGAYLVTLNKLSPGGMIAASIILAKGFATIEALLNHIPILRQNYRDYKSLCAQSTETIATSIDMPDLDGHLRIEGIIIPRGGGAPPRLDRVTLQLAKGECLAIVGPSGSGKTSLMNAMSGEAPPPIGSVFFDDNELKGLPPAALNQSVGYLPQQAALISGTIAQNICGFATEQGDAKILTAAKLAGVHGLIAALPKSYETDLSHDMYLLSSGQRQRIALARALYGDPQYLFLDEPNALLDAEGEKALAQTLLRLKEQGTTIVMILHRSGIMGLADKVLRLERGRVADFGPRREVLARLGLGGRRIELPILESSSDDLKDWVASQFTRSSDEAFSQKAQAVAAELFSIACQNQSKNTPRIASFVFTFVDDTHCEISMVEDLPNDLAKKMASARENLRKSEVFLTDLPRDEAALARISKLCDRYQVRNSEDATHFTVSLAGDTDISDKGREWIN